MKELLTATLILTICGISNAQIDKEQFALDVSKAEAANTEKLKGFIWKRHSTTSINGEPKATLLNEVRFDDKGEIQVTNIEAESNVKNKRGIRGKIQDNKIEDNMEYVGKALQLAVAYTYLSKGQMLDFFLRPLVFTDQLGNDLF